VTATLREAVEEALMAQPAPALGDGEPARQRPGHLLDVLGEIGAATVRGADQLGDREDGVRHHSIVPLHLARAVHHGRVFHGALPGAEPAWSLLTTATLAEACAQGDPAALRAALVAHAAAVTAWIQALDERRPA